LSVGALGVVNNDAATTLRRDIPTVTTNPCLLRLLVKAYRELQDELDTQSFARITAGVSPYNFITVATGKRIPIPMGWVSRPAENGKGTNYQRPGAPDNADLIRIMDPTLRAPVGYLRFYNQAGQPLDVNGRTGNSAATHILLDYPGQIMAGWPR